MTLPRWNPFGVQPGSSDRYSISSSAQLMHAKPSSVLFLRSCPKAGNVTSRATSKVFLTIGLSLVGPACQAGPEAPATNILVCRANLFIAVRLAGLHRIRENIDVRGPAR